jgi:glycosyltransferase A (GT-A) superfamily protein (DUF2064 family)
VESLVLNLAAVASVEPHGLLARERGRRDAALLQTAFAADIADLGRRWRIDRHAGDANRRLVFAVDDDGSDPVVVDLAWRAGARVERATGSTAAERLRSIVDAEFARGARSVAIVGTQAPTLPLHLVDHAFRALAWERCVVGPTVDGGLWLLGMQRGAAVVLPDGPWSTAQTLALWSTRLDAAPHLLPFWYDVTDAASVERLVWHLRAHRASDAGACAATWQALVRTGLVQPDATTTSSPLSPWSPREANPSRQ